MSEPRHVGQRLAAAVAVAFVAALCLGAAPPDSTESAEPIMTAKYECGANAHCSALCLVDGKEVLQTGIPKTVALQQLTANSYYIELTESNGQVHFVHLTGRSVVCNFNGFTKAAE